MNKVFKVIWNHATQTWTAVSELGHAKGKTKSKKIVKLTALAGAVIGSLAVSQSATAAVGLDSNRISIAPNGAIATAGDARAIAVGNNATATALDTVAISTSANAPSHLAIAIGKEATANSGLKPGVDKEKGQDKESSVIAIGAFSSVKPGAQTVYDGSSGKLDNTYTQNSDKTWSSTVGTALAAIAIGDHSNATRDGAVGIGSHAKARGDNSVYLGATTTSVPNAGATNVNSIAIGTSVESHGFSSVAIGGGSKALKDQAIAVGRGAKAKDVSTIAQGFSATANTESDIAIGTNSVANGTRKSQTSCAKTNPSLPGGATCEEGTAIAVGKNSNATGYSAISVGKDSSASFDHAIAIGDSANATHIHSVAIGSAASAQNDGAFAGGYNATASGKNSLALGFNSQSNNEGDVALGATSITGAAVPTANITIAGETIEFAGTKPKSVVSVGRKDAERQIQNVAAGQINSKSTDAINGSQLYAVAEKLGKGWNLKTKKEAGESTEATENIAPDENVTLLAGKNIKLTQTKGNVVIATKNDVFFDTANIGGININTGGIQMNNQKITGLRAGEVNATSQDAVNGSQLYTNPFVFQGFNGNNTGTGDQVASDYVYRPGMAGNAPLQLVALNGLKMTANPNSNNTYKLEIDTESDIYKGLKGQDGKDGKSVTATVTNNNNGTHTLTVTNSDGTTTTTIISDGAKGEKGDPGVAGAKGDKGDTGATGEKGDSITGEVVDNEDGTHTITITDLGTGSVTTTIVKDGKNGKDGKDGATGATGAKGEKGDTGATGPKGDTGATGPKGDTGATGPKGDAGATGATGPQEHVSVVAKDKTVKVEDTARNANGTVKYEVSANTTNVTVNPNGTTKVDTTNGGTGDNLVNATTVVNAINDASFNVTTGKHVDEVVTDTAAGSVQSKVKPGSTVTITSGKNVAVNQTGTTFTISTTADVTHNNVTANNIVATNVTAGDVTAENVTANNVTTKNITVENGGNIDMGGNQVHNVANGTNPTDAVNLSQLKANTTEVISGNQSNVTLVSKPNDPNGKVYKVDVNTTALSNITNTGKITVPDANTAGNKGLVTAIDVANAINAAYWKVGDNAGAVKHNVTAGSQVNFVNGNATSSNVTVDANGLTKVSYDVNAGDGLHIDGNNKLVANVTDIKEGDNVHVNKDNGVYTISANNTQASVSTDPNKGITVTPTVNANGTTNYKVTVDVDNDTITVNNQGKLVATPNGSTNFNVSTSNAGNKVANKDSAPKTTHITGGKTINYAAGKNIAIDQDNGNILISTTDNVDHNSVTTNDLTVNKGGNIDMGGNQIHNVKAGTKDTDAVNVSQLKQSIGDVHKRINKVGKEARGGIAGANAAAGLPQVYIPGKSMVAASAGTFKGESAVAVGYSRSSDNGKVIFKLQGNANTQGDVGGSVGVGYQW